MSDRMRQIPFGQLMTWALNEYESEKTVFGVSKLYKHVEPQGTDPYEEDDSECRFWNLCASESPVGSKSDTQNCPQMELPIGPAAGPHTQLAQNLIAAYVSGARFFELKTVQALDGEDLPVSKPCIYAQDEGYNVEWSTELYVPQALDEYIKGWFALKLLSCELELGSGDGFAFNMSVGYDLEGIQTPKTDSFIEGLKNAQNTVYWNTCMQWARDNLTRFRHVNRNMLDGICPNVSSSITLSTLHGCPPDEIERIAAYLLKEKGLHTFIKLNPTLVGYDYARSALDKLGYSNIAFDDKHFRNDLQFEDAVKMLGRLQALAESLSLEFGVKLTNTFPVQILKEELPGEEMYMSGRALFPLSIEAAYRLSKAFEGRLRISYSGGADARNIASILDAGIWPVTLATTLLKPGGYERLHQIAVSLQGAQRQSNPVSAIDLDRLQALAQGAANNVIYKKHVGMQPNRKLETELPMLDCFTAPCNAGCPFGQDVPAYMRLMREGKHLDALRVITERNPLPHITGTICSRNCMNKCMRYYYEQSVDIRAVKLTAAHSAFGLLMDEIASAPKAPQNGKRVAIVGGGPAGLAAAYFLAKVGCAITLYEQKDSLGGVVRHAIPEFRIGSDAIDNDISLVMSAGLEVKLNVKIADLAALRAEGYDCIVVAVGAWKPNMPKLNEGNAIDALEFLEELKRNPDKAAVGKYVVVIGGGNTAMDAARAAARAKGAQSVTLAYRRTKQYMPAEPEELELAKEDGVEFLELAVPTSLKDGKLTCGVMKLGEPDSSGRPGFEPTGESIELPCDTLISAIGNKADKCLFEGEAAQDVYVIGDAARGPATVAEAIADAAKCAQAIAGASFDKYSYLNESPSRESTCGKKGVICLDCSQAGEQDRCLECATVCNVCAEVCPNRANICVSIDSRPQIAHIDFMCNECGNCAVFCPYEGSPYLDKFTYFIYEQDFEESENQGFLAMENGTIRVRLDGKVTDHRDGADLPNDIWLLIEKCLEKFSRWFL